MRGNWIDVPEWFSLLGQMTAEFMPGQPAYIYVISKRLSYVALLLGVV